MQQLSQAKPIPMEALDIDQERLQRALAASRRNIAFFQEHGADLFEQCPDGWILIYGEQEIEMFTEFLDAAERRSSLDQADRDSSIVRHQRRGVWIL